MIYPNSEWQDTAKLAPLLSSFWGSFFPAEEQIDSVLAARADQNDQVDIEFQTLLNSVSLDKIRPTRFIKQIAITFKVADAASTAYNSLRYGDDGTYNAGLFYGQAGTQKLVAYPFAPAQQFRLLTNRLSEASLTLTTGLEFIVSNGLILFKQDPALDPNVVIEDGEFTLWAHGVEDDRDDLFTHFGYITGYSFPSGLEYRRWLHAYYRSLNHGSTKENITNLIAAACDAPVANSDGEVVQALFKTSLASWAVTDKYVYRSGLNATWSIAIGDKLSRGQLLSDALTVTKFHSGASYSELPALALGENFVSIPGSRGGELVFENKDKPTIITTDQEYTRLEFEIKGNPGDVQAFWDNVHARGVASNQTLAMLLDTREVKEGQPNFVALPRTINPLKFLFDNFYRTGLVVFTVRPASYGPKALPPSAFQVLHALTPPQCCYLIAVEFAGTDVATTPSAVTESWTYFSPLSGTDTALDPNTFESESGTITQAKGRCIS